jgi:carboxyl-terminal processing protease
VSADSIDLDSSKAYTTLGGRTVFGGGGIMPDVFVPADTAESSEYMSELFYTGTLNQFTFNVADRDRTALEGYGDAAAYTARYRVSDALLNELSAFAEKQGIAPDRSALLRSRRPLAARVKAGIARNVWGAQGYYAILLDTDPIFQKAKAELARR